MACEVRDVKTVKCEESLLLALQYKWSHEGHAPGGQVLQM